MTILRIYDPAECDENGVPLDWERCRACGDIREHGDRLYLGRDPANCGRCDGHGSLKAAVLWELAVRCRGVTHPLDGDASVRRCEDCRHPMSEGTWEGPRGAAPPAHVWELFIEDVRLGYWPTEEWIEHRIAAVHYSPCDEECDHNGAKVRWYVEGQGWVEGDIAEATGDHLRRTNEDRAPWWNEDMKIEASWRQVDVWTLGWPHDLRPERLAVLCLRCFADRKGPDGD